MGYNRRGRISKLKGRCNQYEENLLWDKSRLGGEKSF